jgi:S1-C subfamily serine protease
VPGIWPDDDHAGDADDEPSFTPPVHPDDRLWRHPSELAWAPLHRSGPPGPAAAGVAAEPAGGRPWGLVLMSGLLGAAFALGAVALVGGLGTGGVERIVERVGVRNQLGDPLDGDAEDGLPDLVASVSPSVVRLQVDTGGDPVAGSGVVVLDDGHILTNAHVLDGARSVTIVLADGTAVAGEVVGLDRVTDLAVVAPLDPGAPVTWTPAVRGSVDDLRVGEPAVALSAAEAAGGDPSALLGVISALGRRVALGDGVTLHGMIETDLAIGPLGSGGALCDRTGRVVGLTTAAGAGDGMGYATSMDEAWATAEAIIADGVVHHVWLGIEGADLGATDASVLGIVGAGGGVVVERVVEAGPAAAAGLVAGDVLVAFDGDPVASMSDLVLGLRRYRPGDTITFGVVHDGGLVAIPITLGERPG